MNIFVNGECRQIISGLTAAQLLSEMGFSDQRIALERNLEILPRSLYHNTILQEGDKIEIVRAIGGG